MENPAPPNPIHFALWNIENLFNPEIGGPRKDYTPEFGWTWNMVDKKIVRLAEVLQSLPSGIAGPDILGLIEIDEEIMVRKFLSGCLKTGLWDYVIPKELNTGNLDTCLFFRSDRFALLHHESFINMARYPKGDILNARFREKATGQEFLISLNHWASRLSGDHFTRSFRCTAAENLQARLWHLAQAEPDLPILIAGDFNDDPFSPSILDHLNATFDHQSVRLQKDEKKVYFYNPSWETLQRDPPGSLWFDGGYATKWNLFDQIMVSRHFLKGTGWTYRPNSFKVSSSGMADAEGRPIACFVKDPITGKGVIREGVSDHFPVSIILDWKGPRP